MKIRELLLHITTHITLIVVSILVLLGLFWWVYPYKVMVIQNPTAIQVNKSTYRAGDRITYTIDYCKYVKVKARAYRALVNGTITSYTPIEGSFDIGCRVSKKSDLIIPEFTESDTYHIETTLEYRVNPIRTETVYWRSVDFKVIQ